MSQARAPVMLDDVNLSALSMFGVMRMLTTMYSIARTTCELAFILRDFIRLNGYLIR